MREEEYWTRPENDQYNDFVQFWDAFHFGPQDDGECAWRDVQTFCQDFEFLSADECSIQVSYNPCETDYFNCELTKWNDYGEQMMEDCAEDFEDREFWSVMREEQYWMNHPEHAEFVQFWNEFHFASDCPESSIEWFDFECNEFSFTDPTDECRIEVAWSNCNATAFECAIRRQDDMGNAEYCSHDFKDSEFWAMFAQEAVMQ